MPTQFRALVELDSEIDIIKFDILDGLHQSLKSIPTKLLFDHDAIRLWNQLRTSHELFPSTAEMNLLDEHIEPIGNLIPENTALVDFGCGRGEIAKKLLAHTDTIETYIPIDAASQVLMETVKDVTDHHSNLDIIPVHADFQKQFFKLPLPKEKNIVALCSSTSIGMLNTTQLKEFLHQVFGRCHPKGGLLVGLELEPEENKRDLVCEEKEGLCQKFGLHLLERMNKEFDMNFAPNKFKYKLSYNTGFKRIEMLLESLKAQSVAILDTEITIDVGECIKVNEVHTHKPNCFRLSCESIGFKNQLECYDSKGMTTLHYYTASINHL
ncbi:MAG: L-histidine N(alpha)-methyltransferase [Myxococcota bacterium]|nr:L-histidine N(alpha)-methyltransferase [Myxococcota bacterium]